MSASKSLQERIVNEIESTYSSIADYKNRIVSKTSIAHKNTAKQRVQIIEHKLKTLKMMLAKIDDGNRVLCVHCEHPISVQRLVKKPSNTTCATCAS